MDESRKREGGVSEKSGRVGPHGRAGMACSVELTTCLTILEQHLSCPSPLPPYYPSIQTQSSLPR
jgi:hypothetical protein